MTTPADGRRLRGDRTRQRAARAAARLATVQGLDALSVGTLAEASGASKSGLLTVFGNREEILLAAVAEARELYVEHVIAPAWSAAPGAARLRALLDQWVAYLRAEVFPGGCFVAATSAEYGHRTGRVAEAVRALKQEWLDLLVRELTAAGVARPDEAAFRVDAYLVAANTRRELFGDDGALVTAHRLALAVLDEAPSR
ncbi:TetR family transcriptional regulator [Pimelobacter simplex]|uniref:Transcriptional regulator, TetR family n=1 Tax=Nocardioides simplex TaxID=2045 RepID=A0A0A1DIR2_NOCSI|nr:TetR family transcriptional regulator [Pimelobacter simplex]AIY17214.1 Transcriptional regulator, TetR family [Pimelobacter simplex]MCG8151590.1 TetR family transcriptional regulator [Pimelobacter simplex]GEB13227.1 TetR family transcriptional regulator [Pimelobacter simplex]SFM47820.1 transcriptional regulator, TetR family [Pimelobacter simplex]